VIIEQWWNTHKLATPAEAGLPEAVEK